MQKDPDSINPEETCFVISPIDAPDSEVRRRSDIVFNDIISPAAEENELQAIRADQISEPGNITTQVIQHILNDKLVVADLTDRNANVFYEYALRHAFRKPVLQLLVAGQEPPFNLLGIRTIAYSLDLQGGTRARNEVSKQMRVVLKKGYRVNSPVTMAATIDVTRSPQDISQLILTTIQEQFEVINKRMAEIPNLKALVPPAIRDSTEQILGRYAGEIDLLQAVRYAGVIGIYKRREMALNAFSRAIDEESREIMVIGSSLKGLLQREEYREIAEKLRFKADRGLVHVKFLLTHPIVADFRAGQENRRPTEIGHEIISSLATLKQWNDKYCHVRLYLGTPTCFAIKTSNKMMINPYPYVAVSYDSPCLLLEYSPEGGTERPSYFFDEFNRGHFEAWDSNLSVHVSNYDAAIEHFREMLGEYANGVEAMLDRGKLF